MAQEVTMEEHFVWMTTRRIRPGTLAEFERAWRPDDGRIKHRVLRPSLLSMRLDDPAEAAESAALMPSLRRHFTIEEEHSYGAILPLALQDIAHNFMADDPATARVVQQCIAAEEQALARPGPNFILAVCRPHDRPGAGPGGVSGTGRR
jgi:hypothetical protein